MISPICERAIEDALQTGNALLKYISANVRRDAENERKLRDEGWDLMVVWQCELSDLGKISERLLTFLGDRSGTRPARNSRQTSSRRL